MSFEICDCFFQCFFRCCCLKTVIFGKQNGLCVFVFFQSLQNSNITLTLLFCFGLVIHSVHLIYKVGRGGQRKLVAMVTG